MDKEEFERIIITNELDGYSRWNVGNRTQHILPPLSLDQKLMMVKINDNDYSRVDFRLFIFNVLLIFHELLSDQKYGFDIDDISQDKIYFRVSGDKGVVWTRLSIESVDDLLSYFQ